MTRGLRRAGLLLARRAGQPALCAAEGVDTVKIFDVAAQNSSFRMLSARTLGEEGQQTVFVSRWGHVLQG